jgi:hypothetical protein
MSKTVAVIKAPLCCFMDEIVYTAVTAWVMRVTRDGGGYGLASLVFKTQKELRDHVGGRAKIVHKAFMTFLPSPLTSLCHLWLLTFWAPSLAVVPFATC